MARRSLSRLLKLSPPSFRDAPEGAGPESILTIVVMDSGLALCAPRNDEPHLNLVRLALGQHRADVTFQHLLHQIEGIEDLADLRDPAVAQGVKRREVELHGGRCCACGRTRE